VVTPRSAASSGPFHHAVADNAYRLRAGDTDLEVTRTGLRWSEGADVDLQADLVGPGLQHVTVWPGGGLFYTSRLFTTRGLILGEDVDGFLLFDQWYLDAGASLRDWPGARAFELGWHTFGNRFDDGSVEVGTIGAGHGRWGFALVNDATGSVIATNDVDIDVVERDSDGWPLLIHYTVAGEPWDWRADPLGRMPDYGIDILNPQSEGQLRRVGDKRTAVSWMGWGETCKANGDRRGTTPRWPA
jgi:hypothetical protein